MKMSCGHVAAKRTIAVGLVLVAFSTLQVSGNSQQVTPDENAQLNAAFSAVERARTIDDLLREARTASYNTQYVREGLWYAASLGTLPDEYGRDPVVSKRIIKSFVYATLLDLGARGEISKWPTNEHLFTSNPSSLNRLSDYIVLAREGDPLLGKGDALRSWLDRGASIDESTVDGSYQYLRLNLYTKGIYLLFERTDVPIGMLGPQWTKLQGPLDQEAKAKTTPAEGLFYSLPLASTGYIITIVKAYLCLSLLSPDSPLRKYALTVVGNSFYSLSRASGTNDSYEFANTASSILQGAVAEFRKQPNIHGKLLTAETLARRLTAARFFARKFASALEDYEKAAKDPKGTVDFNLYGEFGAAMCLLGMRNSQMATQHFKRMVTVLQGESQEPALLRHRYVIATLIDAEGARFVLGDMPISESLRTALDSWRRIALPEAARYRINLDLLHILYTIGDYAAAARVLMPEIARVNKQPEQAFRLVESDYLRELAATMSDVFSQLSWTFDQDASVAPKLKDMREWSYQFVPTPIDRYVGGCRGTNRYGACSPEEDRATVIAFYAPNSGMILGSVAGELLHLIEGKVLDPKVLTAEAKPYELAKAMASGEEFARWVQQEYLRKPSSLVPVLKLAWAEWFYFPFITLNKPGPAVVGWHYSPRTESRITSVEEIDGKAIKFKQSVDPDSLRTWELFKECRAFLLKHYGVTPNLL